VETILPCAISHNFQNMQISVEYRLMMAPTNVRWVDIGVQYSQSQCGAVWFRVVQWSVLKATATRTAARNLDMHLCGSCGSYIWSCCHSWLPRTTTTTSRHRSPAQSACGAGLGTEIANLYCGFGKKAFFGQVAESSQD